MNNPYKSYFVDFSILSKPNVLGKILQTGSETYNNLISHFSHWAKEQKKGLSKTQRKAIVADEEKAEALYAALNEQWSLRCKFYNQGKLTGGRVPDRQKRAISLAKGKNTRGLLRKALSVYDEDSISLAFVAYADSILKGNIKPDKILLYFLKKNEDGDFDVINKFMDKINIDYVTK